MMLKPGLLTFINSAKAIGAGLATIGPTGAGAGVGIVFGSSSIASARNPNVKDELFRYAISGFALTEAVGLPAPTVASPILFM